MRKIIFIILGIIILAGGGWYWYAKSRQTQDGVPAITDFGAFFPIGRDTVPNVPGTLPTGAESVTNTAPTASSAFKQLSPDAVAGFTPFTATVTTTTPGATPKEKPVVTTTTKHFLRYVARTNGYVYEIEDGGMPLQITNVYIPNIYESAFGDKFATAILRFLRADQRTIATYAVPVPPPNPDGTRTQKEGSYLPDNMVALAPSPDGTQVARITTDAQGALLSLSTPTNTKRVDILKSPFREWILSWPTAKSLYLQTKASAQVPGYLYRVDTIEKKLRRVLGNINGLTTSVSPSGTYILYAQNSGGSFVTKLLNTKTNTTQNLSLTILPEKCTWLKNEDLICAGNTTVPEAQYPDAWYQGTVTFSDQLYRIYTGAAIYDTLYDNSGASYDMTHLATDEALGLLYFIDKQTGVLWQFRY